MIIRFKGCVALFVALFISIPASRTIAAEECSSGIRLTGNREVVGSLEAILTERGIDVNPWLGCHAATAEMGEADGRLQVKIEDRNGRKISRTATDLNSAASIIESWVRDDLVMEALPSPPAPVATTKPAVKPAKQRPAQRPVEQSPEVLSAQRAIFALGVTTGTGFDGSGWFGGAASACRMAGPTCIGGLFALSLDVNAGDYHETAYVSRFSMSFKASLDFPVFFRRFTLRPGVTSGAVVLRTDVEAIEERTGKDEDSILNYIENITLAWSVGAHVGGSFAIGLGFFVTMDAFIDVLPLVDTAPYSPNDKLTMPGLPRGFFKGLLGLEYVLR